MRTRLLPREEWSRLPDRELLEPDSSVVVVEMGDRIVGRVKAIRVTHLEGLEIAPEYHGNPGVARALMRGVDRVASRWSWVWAAADTDAMRSILERMGAKRLDLDSYVFKGGS